MLFTLFKSSGPAIGFFGYHLQYDALFWVGALLAGINLYYNLASGVMNFPLLPLAFAAIGLYFFPPWYFGAALGLLSWTALEAVGAVYSRLRGF